jgi:Domain of unknown function (DUF6434)/SAP domain-containing new25
MERPDIKNITTGAELKRWYWAKEELVAYCKDARLSYIGVKFDILQRIAETLDNPLNAPQSSVQLVKPTSKFIWSKAELSLSTVITDSYTNGQNTRKFFQEHCGDKFHFSIPFM